MAKWSVCVTHIYKGLDYTHIGMYREAPAIHRCPYMCVQLRRIYSYRLRGNVLAHGIKLWSASGSHGDPVISRTYNVERIHSKTQRDICLTLLSLYIYIYPHTPRAKPFLFFPQINFTAIVPSFWDNFIWQTPTMLELKPNCPLGY